MTKKKYAGMTVDGKLMITGLEAKRSDWSMVARRTQLELLKMVFDDATEEDVRRYLKDVRRGLKELPTKDFILEKIVDTSRVYVNKTNILKAYETLYGLEQTQGGWKPVSPYGHDALIGIRWIYGRNGIPIGIPDDAAPEQYRNLIDYDYYWKKQILPPVKRLCDAIGFSLDEYRQETLSAFTA